MNKNYISIFLTIIIAISCIITILNIFNIVHINNLTLLGIVLIATGFIGLNSNNYKKSNAFLAIAGVFVLIVSALQGIY